jgi:hypothetical protein
MGAAEMAEDRNEIFAIDEGFGGTRLKVAYHESEQNGGGAFIQLFETDRDQIISIDLDLWKRIAAAVVRAEEA